MKTRLLGAVCLAVFAVVVLGGCSKKDTAAPEAGTGSKAGGIDLSAPISELKAAAANMDLSQLEKTAEQYMTQITAKKDELEKLAEQFKAIPMAQKMGEEAKELQGEITDLTGTLGDLMKRFEVYLDAIKEKGGDVSKFTIS